MAHTPTDQTIIEGRIVHYVAYNGRHLAAIITGYDALDPHFVDLAVFTNMRNVNGAKTGGLQFHFDVNHTEATEIDAVGTWHFPSAICHTGTETHHGND